MATASNPWGSFGNISVGGSSSAPTTTGGSTITNVDRIDIGVGPILNPAPTDTSGFKFVGQKAISEQDYLSRKVDFGSEFLDIGSLGQQTGISVTAPAVGEDVALADTSVYSEDDAPQDDVPDILKGTLIQGTGESREITTGVGGIPATHSKYNTYSEYLADKQLGDRVNIGTVQSLYEPLARGEMPSFSQLGLEAKEAAQELPGEAKKGIQSLFTKKGMEEAAKKGMSASFSMAGPIMGLAGGLIGGGSVKNAFGEDSFRPSGFLGAVADAVHSRQYQDMAEIRAAELAGGFGDKGFAIKFGNFGLTRRPGGGGYIGNMQGMSFNQVKELEALSKGYVPSTYSFDVTQKSGFFGQKLNQTVEESGGMFSDPNQPLKGYYTADGKYYTPGVGVSSVGMKADMQRLATSNGLDYDTMKDIVTDARAGKGNLSDLVSQHKADVAAEQAAQQAAEQAQKEQEKKPAQTNQQAANQAMGGYYDSSYGGDDDDGGWSSGGAGSGGSGGFGVGSFGTSGGGDRGFTGGFADGGTVGMAAGGAMAANMNSGFIGAPPSQVPEEKTVADDQNTAYPEGTFIINAAAVEFAGEKDIVKMLNDAQKEAVRRGIVLDNTEKGAKLIDVAVSQGEVKVAPYLAKIIGYDRLNKINNRGKPEVAERQQEAAQGGFLDRPGYASGDMVTVYRGEPIDPTKAEMTHNYGYDKENVGKFHSPSIDKARAFAKSAGSGNQQILSRKVTIDQLFDGVEEAWKVGAQKKTEYFGKMPKKELDKNIKFIREMQKAYQRGERSIESMAMFLQEQVFHDDKSKVNFIETFKNDPKSAGKLAGRAISKVATKATPPLAILEMIGTVFAPTKMGDGTLQGNESFLEMD